MTGSKSSNPRVTILDEAQAHLTNELILQEY